MITRQELQEIAETLNRISSYPWRCEKTVFGEWWITAPDNSDHEYGDDYEPIFKSSRTTLQSWVDGEFIAKAPEIIELLVNELLGDKVGDMSRALWTAVIQVQYNEGNLTEAEARKLLSGPLSPGDDSTIVDDSGRLKTNPMPTASTLNSAEAVLGFTRWLMSREEETIMSNSGDFSTISNRVNEFIDANKLGSVSERWPENIIYPAEQQNTKAPHGQGDAR